MICCCGHESYYHFTQGENSIPRCMRCTCESFIKKNPKGGEPLSPGRSRIGKTKTARRRSTASRTKSSKPFSGGTTPGKPGGSEKNGQPMFQTDANGTCRCIGCDHKGKMTFIGSWKRLGVSGENLRDLLAISSQMSFACRG